MKTSNTITIKALLKISTDELNFVMRDDILGKGWDDDDDGFVHEININQDLSISVSIKIEELRKILNKLEEKGCNYVSIDYHCDHVEYDLYGFDIHPATEKEIDDFIASKNRKKINEINSKISELDKERTRLQSLLEK